MKILFLIRALDYGGAERQMVGLALGLQQRGHTVSVAVFYAGGPLEAELRDSGVRVCSLNKKGRWDAFGFIGRLSELARRERPDVAHGYLIFPNILTLFVKMIVPGARAVWGIRDSISNSDSFDWLERILFRAECVLSRFADLIITNSNAGLRQAVANGFPERRTLVIHNGIDTTRFKPDRESGGRVRAEMGVRDDEILIGIVGRFDPLKDHVTFLRAAALLSKERSDVRFVCVGEGPDRYRQTLVDISRELNVNERVVWLPARADMQGLYNALDVLVSSSCSEGFPNVIGEAMSCNVASVVTDVGDSATVVGETGEVVPPKSAEQLKAGIERVLNKRNDRNFETSSRWRIIEHFSFGSLINNTESALTRLCEHSSAILCD